MTSQIMSSIEYLFSTYNILLIILNPNLSQNTASLAGFIMRFIKYLILDLTFWDHPIHRHHV